MDKICRLGLFRMTRPIYEIDSVSGKQKYRKL